MDDEQREIYDEHVKKYIKQNYSSSDDVKKLIIRDLRYKNMHFINPELMHNMDEYYEPGWEEELNEIYVFAEFMKPGR